LLFKIDIYFFINLFIFAKPTSTTSYGQRKKGAIRTYITPILPKAKNLATMD